MSASSSTPTALIVNPAARGGATGRHYAACEYELLTILGNVEPALTTGPGHATELARGALRRGAKLVVVMGGDGTLSEAVDGFFDGTTPIAPDAALGLLPSGTGGDFRKTMGTPATTPEAARALLGAPRRAIDVGRLTYTDDGGHEAVRHFVNIASFGIGGLVDRYVNASGKALGGKISFFVASMQATLRYRNAACRLTLDEGAPVEGRFYSVAVANGRYFGGGMKMAPEAIVDDGLFDVVTIGDIGKARLLRLFSHVYRGTHLGLAQVGMARARKVVAEPLAGEEILLDVDGEAPGRLPATFELRHKVLLFQG